MPSASRFLIAAAETGAGKTTVTIGLLAALRRRGIVVQPFKIGPDYIDPGFLAAAAGRPARNLDAWLLPPDTVRWVFHRHAAGRDAAIVEGMMGLFDGVGGLDDTGSSAHAARLLDLPVIVVLDVSRASRSAAAVARGCQVLDRRLRVAGWVLNRVAGERHLGWVREAVEAATGRPVLGHLPDDPRWRLPERHLGLVQAREGARLTRVLPRLARAVEERFDLDRILQTGRDTGAPSRARPPRDLADVLEGAAGGARAARGHAARAAVPVIAWAMDRAFTFHYADALDLLTDLGARIEPWSPLSDRSLPARTGALVLGGGYPELYARELAANTRALDAVRAFARGGGAVYAECGGLMYLTRGIAAGGRSHRLAGVVPAWARMTPRTRVAYVEVRTARATMLAPRGTVLRGHEFHASVLDRALPARLAAYRVLAPSGRWEGYARPRLLASYVHLNLLGAPRLAARLVEAARGS